MLSVPRYWQEVQVALFGWTRLGTFYRSSGYRWLLRVAGLLMLLIAVAFGVSINEEPPSGMKIKGFSGRNFTLVRWAEVANANRRGFVACVVEEDLETAWDVARYSGNLPGGEKLDFVAVSVVRRFVLPFRKPLLGVRVLSQASPGQWRLSNSEDNKVLPISGRVCLYDQE